MEELGSMTKKKDKQELRFVKSLSTLISDVQWTGGLGNLGYKCGSADGDVKHWSHSHLRVDMIISAKSAWHPQHQSLICNI